jgi:hypothetical protein
MRWQCPLAGIGLSYTMKGFTQVEFHPISIRRFGSVVERVTSNDKAHGSIP